MTGIKEINWDELENRYITGTMTCTRLLDIFKSIYPSLKIKAIRYKCGHRKWVAKREEYQQKIKDKEITASLNLGMLARTSFDELTDIACDSLLSQINEYILINGDLTLIQAKLATQILKNLQEIKYRRLDIALPKQVVDVTVVVAPGDDAEAEATQAVDQVLKEAESMLVSAGGNGSGKN